MQEGKFTPEELNLIRALFNRFWVVRDRDPLLYRRIVERKKKLQGYFDHRFGMRLIINRYFVRLEKAAEAPEPWMGVEEFRSTLDYSLFFSLMAFLMEKNIEEQFLLTHLCESLPEIYPQRGYLDWTHYEHRKSLVRALQKAVELGLLHIVEGEVEYFRHDEKQEVLYEVTVLSRYFLPGFPQEFTAYGSPEEILEINPHLSRKQKVYRRLFLSPALYIEEGGKDLFEYLRRYGRGMQEDIENTSDFELEIYRQVAFLNLVQNPGSYRTYPENRGLSDVALHLAAAIYKEEGNFAREEGRLLMTRAEWEELLSRTREEYGRGWSKELREMKLINLGERLIEYLAHWKMAGKDSERGLFFIYPLFLRIIGEYPRDFEEKEAKTDGKKLF